ncbi:MAG: helix-turn-helix transcriptional regulator [Planctomycetota bacterium]
MMEEHCPCAGATLDKFLQPAVLAVLSERSLHGYRLMKFLAAMPMFSEQSPDATGLYRCLKEMERRGLIASTRAASEKGPAVRVYHATPLGRACLLRWTGTLEKHRRALGVLVARARRVARKNQQAGTFSPALTCRSRSSGRLRAGGVSGPEIGRRAVGDEPGGTMIFQMGLYKALVPKRLQYSKLHFWFDCPDGGGTKCGLTAYAVRLISDIFRLEWRVKPGDKVLDGQTLGEIESIKAVAELYAPMSGTVRSINTSVVADPSLVSVDPYAAWLLEFSGRPDAALQAVEYVQFLTNEWEKTSKLFRH